MIATQLTLISLIISANALSIGTVSEQNVRKRETNLGDLFPDWVPFKNKHGEELGEFVQVKNKPKKRLAPPISFILRAVAEPDGDDYYEKDGGGSDSEDYYEKKDWSDTNRPAQSSEVIKAINHTDISEIDGVVNIITKRPSNPVVEALKKAEQARDTEEIEEIERKPIPQVKDDSAERIKLASRKKTRKYEEEADYEDEAPAEKRKPDPLGEEQEKSESEAKKIRILNTVDELKQRHAKEQVAISERAKEDEMYKEEHERERLQGQPSLDSEADKYDDKPEKIKKKFPDYEEYDEKETEKYTPRTTPQRTKATPSTYRLPSRTSKKQKQYKEKKVETGKLSVFKNPQLYMVYDDDSEETTTTMIPKVKTTTRFSSKFMLPPTKKDSPDRISLVPEGSEGKEGEPALFFPKKRNSKRGKYKPSTQRDNDLTSTTATAKTTTPNATTSRDTTGSDTTGSDTIIVDTTVVTETPKTEAIPTNTAPVTDTIPESTQHHKEPEKKEEDYHREKGGGKEHHSEHENEHSEKGKKAYEGVHEETKSAKGHHDKENHLGKYDDHGGIDELHEEESGHYGKHHHEEHGKKEAKYEESGKHSKGHSTKGSHDIHKKEEYEKKVEFFEEDGDSGEEEKHGGYNEENGHSKGGHFKNGNYKEGHEKHSKGDFGHFAKGGHLQVSQGHKAAAGHDGHFKRGNAQKQKENKESGKKWIFHHGNPAKTANLVLIDRKADNLYHGPQYYG